MVGGACHSRAQMARSARFDNSRRTPEVGVEVLGLVHIWTFERRLISTSKGYIGLANSGVRSGDVVAILGGSSVPIILRPVPTVPEGQSPLDMVDELSFQVVGDAYIHGVMDGEAFSYRRRDKHDMGRLTLI